MVNGGELLIGSESAPYPANLTAKVTLHGRAVQLEPRVCKHGMRRPSPWVSDSMQPRVCHTL